MDIDKLRPEVSGAFVRLAEASMRDGYPDNEADYMEVRAELRRLAKIEKDYGFAIDCERRRADEAEAELAAFKARIATSPIAVVQSAPGAIKASFNGYGCFEYVAGNLQPKLRGKRVRLVVEE